MGVFLYSLRFFFYLFYFISFHFYSRFYIIIIISILYHYLYLLSIIFSLLYSLSISILSLSTRYSSPTLALVALHPVGLETPPVQAGLD